MASSLEVVFLHLRLSPVENNWTGFIPCCYSPYWWTHCHGNVTVNVCVLWLLVKALSLPVTWYKAMVWFQPTCCHWRRWLNASAWSPTCHLSSSASSEKESELPPRPRIPRVQIHWSNSENHIKSVWKAHQCTAHHHSAQYISVGLCATPASELA